MSAGKGMSLLTGKPSPPRASTKSEASEAAPPSTEELKAQIIALQADFARVSAERDSLATALEAARASAASERVRGDSLATQLNEEIRARAGESAAKASAEAAIRRLEAQLASDQESRQALHARLEQAIAAAAQRPPVAPPAAPVAYELVMRTRDVNGRMQNALLRPVKEE